MKIFAYRFEQRGPRSLTRIVQLLREVELEQRYFGGSNVRLEESGNRDGFLLMDFTRERSGHGPGRMSRSNPLREIGLRQGEIFGEDTGIAFDQATGLAAIQYNHYGPRDGSIEDYLYAYDLSLGGQPPIRGVPDQDRYGFKFGALLKRDALARLRRFGIIHEIQFSVNVPGVQNADLEEGRSLGDVLRSPLPEGVETLSMTIKAEAGRDGALGHGRAMGLLQDLQRIGMAVKNAVVSGRPTRDDPIDRVNLIEERIKDEPSIELGAGRRYARADRWRVLSTSLRNWIQRGVAE